MNVLLSVILWMCLTASGTMTGKVVSISDGDTLIILIDGKKQERIRLMDIDAPEKNQPFSEKSKKYLSDMVAGRTVTLMYNGRDRYGRILGTVFIDGMNVNEEMVRVGLAWNYHFSKNKQLAELEADAKRKKLNIFSVPNPISPYEYRKGKR